MPGKPSTNAVIAGCGFHHVAIKAHDFDATLKLYTEVFGFKTKITWGEKPKRAIMMDVGDGNYLEVFEGGEKGHKPEGAILHFALRCNDCDAALARAKAAGLQITMESKNVDIASQIGTVPVRIAFCKGYDGEIIEFFQNELT